MSEYRDFDQTRREHIDNENRVLKIVDEAILQSQVRYQQMAPFDVTMSPFSLPPGHPTDYKNCTIFPPPLTEKKKHRASRSLLINPVRPGNPQTTILSILKCRV